MSILLLALIDDANASAVTEVCKVDLGALKEDLAGYIGGELKALVIADGRDSRLTPGFQRVVERAALSAQIQDRNPTGARAMLAGVATTHSLFSLTTTPMSAERAAELASAPLEVAFARRLLRELRSSENSERGGLASRHIRFLEEYLVKGVRDLYVAVQ